MELIRCPSMKHPQRNRLSCPTFVPRLSISDLVFQTQQGYTLPAPHGQSICGWYSYYACHSMDHPWGGGEHCLLHSVGVLLCPTMVRIYHTALFHKQSHRGPDSCTSNKGLTNLFSYISSTVNNIEHTRYLLGKSPFATRCGVHFAYYFLPLHGEGWGGGRGGDLGMRLFAFCLGLSDNIDSSNIVIYM